MPDLDAFEYAVIRLVPQVEREEFLNIGVILYCRKQKFLDMRYVLDETRIRAFSRNIDIEELQVYLSVMKSVCEGSAEKSPIHLLEKSERFRWLSAKRSSVIQMSAVHPGLTDDAQKTLDCLFEDLVVS